MKKTIFTGAATAIITPLCENGIDFAAKTQAESPIVDKWNEYMKDVMIMEMDPETGAQPMLKEVFRLD